MNGLDVSLYGHEQAAAALRDARDRVDLLLVYSPDGKYNVGSDVKLSPYDQIVFY